ncbi:DNA repair protein RecO [Aurantimonas sp. Leaf443]|uniref:DNA repair protein RecO n=1 Tax=Aurantimonas sp. Leaf443 TaxID=1736378 RepID=UPI0006FA9C1B|nr:DNA repair protein RecO [Aurantimonas sp. Leaf443]KQT88285.1 DNA repair protein RecO [Aurantimonas sp. Leaf443]
MEWREAAIVLGFRRHGETSVIAEVMTRERGRHLGIVRGGRSRKQQPVLQPGNGVEVNWRARLDEQMGTFTVEPLAMRAARLMETAAGLNAIQAVASHLRLLPERDPHPRLYDALEAMADHLGDPLTAGELVLRFELALLEELGVGLDLTRCAATGTAKDLAYVSPKTGRAVGRGPGEPWRDKLFALPPFLLDETHRPDAGELGSAFAMTGFFLFRHVYEPRGLTAPVSRAGLLHAVERAGAEI